MAELSEKYMGLNVFGPDDKKIGTVNGLLVDDDRRQYYVVESSGFLGRSRATYYVPAEKGVATGSQRLRVDTTADRFEELGRTTNPEIGRAHV